MDARSSFVGGKWERRGWVAALIPLTAAVVMGYATHLFAASPEPSASPVVEQREVRIGEPESAFFYAADSDRDVGPGESESTLAQHPAVDGL